MKVKSLLFIGLLSVTTSGLAQHLLPMPQSVEWTKGTFRTDKPFVIKAEKTMVAEQNFITRWKGKTSHEPSTHRRILFSSLSNAISPEAYKLSITNDTIEIKANTPAGFLYAQHTLKQLQQGEKIPCCTIEDAPVYSWRGAMIDVSRHFYPISFLKRQIDVMSYYKLNRLHLHLTDAAGWRMEIKRYPRLQNFAAWRTDSLWKNWWNGGRRYAEKGTEGAYGGYYTQKELHDLVKYAQQRNIIIVPEIEMPAHSEEVLTAYPELSCTHEPYKQADFCPGSVATYDFLENVLKEVMAVFPSPYIHVGGDEAGKSSWPKCPLCQQKMKEENIQEVKGLQTYLIRHIGQFLNQHGRQLVGWDEIIDGNLAPGTHVMVWRDQNNAIEAARHGYDVILSPGAHCYFDSYQDAPSSQPEAIGGFLTLEKAYQLSPENGMNDQEKKHIKGVQGNLWTEYVPTEAHAEYMLYPRLLAIAEIGWKGAAQKDYQSFRKRATHQTDYLRSQGIQAFDLHQEIGDRPESLSAIKHKAVHKKITYNKPVSPYYKGNSENTLIDGQLGGWNYGDGRWQGFIGRDCLDVTIDLGKTIAVKKIRTDFLQCSRPDIFYPGTYQISISVDGQHFTNIYKKEHEVSKLPLVDTDFWEWKGKKQARYVRIEASSGKMRGWIFCDEIEIF